MRGPVETKVAAGGGAGALVSLLFGLAAQYHWFTPPSPYLTALAVTVLSFAAGWLAPHTAGLPAVVPAPVAVITGTTGTFTTGQLGAQSSASAKP